MILLIILTGCQPKLISQTAKIICLTPEKPILTKLNESDLCTKDNQIIILDNLNMGSDYTEKLISTIKCYEDSLK
jgi:hypothetical protein